MTRKALTLKAKVEAMEANALCPKCFKPFGGDTQYDHEISLAAGGKDHDEKPLVPLHSACHAIKTKRDRKVIAKTNRMKNYHETGRSSLKKNTKKICNGKPLTDPHMKKKVSGQVIPRTE